MPISRTSETLNQRNVNFDNRLRPGQFAEFIGQQKIRDRLELAVKAAKERNETLDGKCALLEALQHLATDDAGRTEDRDNLASHDSAPSH